MIWSMPRLFIKMIPKMMKKWILNSSYFVTLLDLTFKIGGWLCIMQCSQNACFQYIQCKRFADIFFKSSVFGGRFTKLSSPVMSITFLNNISRHRQMSTRHFWSDFSVFQWRTGLTILYYLSTIIFLIYRIDIRCVLTGSMLTSDGNLLPSGGGCRLSDSDDFCQLAGKCFILCVCHLRSHYLNPLHPTKKNNWTRLIYK